MKKSEIWTMAGIISILLPAVWDAFLAKQYDIQKLPEPWAMAVWLWLIVFGALFFAGIGMIIFSCVLAKREKRAAQEKEGVV